MTRSRAIERFHNPYGEPGEIGRASLSGWPTPHELRGKNMTDDPLLFERAPFLAAAGLRDTPLIRSYADVTGALPGGLSLRAEWSRDFSFRLAVKREHVWPKYRREGCGRRQKYMAALVRRLVRTPCNRRITVEWDFDTGAYRTEGDRGYVANLRRILENLPDRVEEPAVEYLTWDKPILPPRFKEYVEREGNPGYYDKLKYERRMRNALGILVAYEWIEATTFQPRPRYERYPQIPHWFSQ